MGQYPSLIPFSSLFKQIRSQVHRRPIVLFFTITLQQICRIILLRKLPALLVSHRHPDGGRSVLIHYLYEFDTSVLLCRAIK